MSSRIIAFAVCMLLAASLAFAQTKTGLVAQFDMPKEINLGKLKPDSIVLPVKVSVISPDGKPYNGMLDLQSSVASFLEADTKKDTNLYRTRVKFKNGTASVYLKHRYGPIRLLATIGTVGDMEILGEGKTDVRMPDKVAVIEEETRRVATNDGKDHPVVTILVKDQAGNPMPDCETSADCNLLKKTVVAVTDSKGIARLNIPPCKTNMLVSCQINAGASCVTHITVFYATSKRNTYEADGLKYKHSDVVLAQKMIADEYYDAAISRLTGFDYRFFGPASPDDAARAQILLCRAYEAKGEAKSEACETVRKELKENLSRVWYGLTVQEPDINKRLKRIAWIFEGQPQAFADFTGPMIADLIASKPYPQDLKEPQAYFSFYNELMTGTPAASRVVDTLWIAQIANMALRTRITGNQPQITALVKQIYMKYPCCIMTTDPNKAKTYFIVKNYPAGIDAIKRVFKANPKDDTNLMGYLHAWLLGIGDKEHLILASQASLTDDSTPGFRWVMADGVGDMLRELNRYEEAIAEYSKIANLGTKNQEWPSALYKIALCNKELGNKTLAAQQLAEVVNKYPESMAAKSAIKQQYIMGVYEDAPQKSTDASAAR